MDEESKEFLLEEYKAAWEMVKYLSQQRDKWVKYYFAIVATGFSYIGVALKLSYDKALEKELILYEKSFLYILNKTLQIGSIISISIIFLLFLLFIIGIAVFITTLYWRKQSTEYYNALNEIRRLFKERDYDIYYYITLRTDTKKAFAKEGVDFWTSLMIGIVNIAILSLLIIVLYFVFFPTWWLILIGTLSLIVGSIYHIYKYRRVLK